MAAPTQLNPAIDPLMPGYDPTSHSTNVAIQVGTPVQDATTGVWYAPLLSTVSNANANGQATMANSSPVVIASDQSNVPTVLKNLGWTSIYTTTQTGVSSWAGSGDLSVAQYSQVLINCQVTAITGTSIQFKGSRKDAFNNYPGIWNPAAQTTTGGSNTSWGPGLSTNHLFGSTIQVTVALVAITSVTFTVDVQGR